MANDLERKFRAMKRIIVSDPLVRFINFLLDKKGESFALNPRIPYGAKKSLVDAVCDYEMNKIGILRGVNPVAAAFYVLSESRSIPVHMHHQEWKGVPYRIWERKNVPYDSSSYTVFFPNLQFPNFSEDMSLTPELERENDSENDFYNTHRIQLDSNFESCVWNKVLYQSPVFKSRSSFDRPGLSDIRSFEFVPYHEFTKTVRVPFFITESLVYANADARAIVEVYQKYKEPIERIVELLKIDPKVRIEFIDKIGPLEVEQFLRKYGLDIDTLPHVINKTEENHEGVPYTIYEVKGGSFEGSNKVWYYGFINGIQFPDFRVESGLSEYEQRISYDALKLAFDYALYTSFFFKPENGIIHHSTPRFVGGSRYDKETQIVEVNIPKGKVMPCEISSSIEYLKKNIHTSIHFYNNYKDQIAGIVEKLSDGKIQKELSSILEGSHVSDLSDSTAEFLGKHGASFIVKSPYHLERQDSI